MRRLRVLVARLASFFTKSRWDRDLAAEMESNLQLHIEDNMRGGMSFEEARRAAVLRFGAIEPAKETYRDARSLPLLDGLARDFRHASSGIRRNPGFAAVVVATLALGIGANTAIFSVVKTVLLTALPYADPDRLVSVAESDSTTINPVNVDFTTTYDWRTRSRSFEHMALYRDASGALASPNGAELVRAMRVSYDYFDTLGVRPQFGRGFLLEEDRPDRRYVAVLSYEFWQRRFAANADVIGTVLRISDLGFTVVGVLPPGFHPMRVPDSDTSIDLYLPLGYALSQGDACRGCQHLRSVARLKPGVAPAVASAELNAIMRDLVREYPDKYKHDSTVVVAQLRDAMVDKVRAALWLLLGAVGFVLLIACANVMNLLLARATARGREIAVRAALGAGRATLARQLLVESLVLALAGGAAGTLLAYWGTPALATLAPKELPRMEGVRIDSAVLMFTLAASIASGILFGLAPALRASRVDLNAGLRDQRTATGDRSGRRLRSALITLEFAMAFVLAAGTGLLGKSFLRLTAVDPGYDPRNVLTLNTYVYGDRYKIGDAESNYYGEVARRVEAVPGVRGAAFASTFPLSGFDRRGLHIEDLPLASEAEAPPVDTYSVSPEYFRVMGIALRRGRLFTDADRAGAPAVALVSESCARQAFGGADPVGKHIKLGGRGAERPWATIVGVVGDIRQYGLDRSSAMEAYLPLAQNLSFAFSMLVRTSEDPARFERSVRDVFASVDKNLPIYNVASLESYLRGTLAQRRFTLALLVLFCAVALVLAAVGIYGVISYTVSLRSREVGIRMALGAKPGQVARMVLLEGLALTAGGLALGLSSSVVVTRVLGTLLYDVRPVDPPTLLAVAFALTCAAMTATIAPARRASHADPIASLRQD